MPSIQKRRVSVAEELASIQARLTKLETFPANGMTLLVSQFNYSSVTTYNYSASLATIPDFTPPAFTLHRPVPILLISTFNYFGASGTATAISVQASLSLTDNVGQNTPATDIAGNYMQTISLWEGNPTAANNAGNFTGIGSWIVPEGTYHAHISYYMNGGALTTITLNGGSVQVFQLSG
jgi:hypothetical protein